MRYITNSNGYLQQVSFGADIACGDQHCTQYTGTVPSGYKSLEEWYCQECESLYRWKIVDGQLTLDSAATAPTDFKEPVESADYPGCYYRIVNGEVEWVNPPMVPGVVYRTTERSKGKPVYAGKLLWENMPNNTYKGLYIIPYGGRKVTDVVSVQGRATNGTLHYGFPMVQNGTIKASVYANAASAGGMALYTVTYADMTAYACEVECKWIHD